MIVFQMLRLNNVFNPAINVHRVRGCLFSVHFSELFNIDCALIYYSKQGLILTTVKLVISFPTISNSVTDILSR